MIEVEDLAVFLDKEKRVPLLKGINFSVKKGTSFGLVGPSGCGKSTLLRCVAALHPHWTGHLSIKGGVQMVFQDPLASLHPKHSVYKILSEPLRITKNRVEKELLEEMLEKVSLPPSLLKCYPHELSGGQRQRLSIARSLVLHPEILLLDECTSSLDTQTEKKVIHTLEKLQEELGLTYLMVSHNLPLVRYFCKELLSLS